MASQRNRVLELVNYLESLGIIINIGKNKARGNKGVFFAKDDSYRIDVAKGQENSILGILAHEFAHFVHYKNDKTLSDINFAFETYDELLEEELIDLTVHSIPQKSIKPFFEMKEKLKKEIDLLQKELKSFYPDFKTNIPCKKIENKLLFNPLKHLLKYDRVKVFNFLESKIYSVDSLIDNTDINLYLRLKSKQRALKRINSKMSKLNRYYNSPTELFARFFEYYITDEEFLKQKAPYAYSMFEEKINKKQNILLTNFISKAKS